MEQLHESHNGAEPGAARLERRLLEAWDTLCDRLVDPREAYLDSDGEAWLSLDRSRASAAGAAFSSEAELREIRRQCRALALENEFAVNGHENRISYIVGSGHTYRALPRAECACDDRLPGDVQRVIDEFARDNAWRRRQQEIVRRMDRDGEVFLRFFAAADGRLRVRFVEPDQVSAPPTAAGDPAASFGVVTAPADVESVRFYYVDGHPVDADEIQHRKANVDVNVKRGLPLFYPVRKNLRRAEKLLRNMSVVSEIQSAIALIRRHHGATRAAVQQFVAGQADAAVADALTGKQSSYRRYGPGTILDSHGGVEYDFPARGLDAARYVAVLQAELRAVAARLVMPEFMLTSDASNANYASTMVAEGPAVKMFERLQAEQIEADLAVLERAIDAAVDFGRLPPAARTDVVLRASAPSLAVRDALREAQVSRIEFEHGVLSPQTWCLRRGLDYAQEQRNLAEHAGSVDRAEDSQ